MSRGVELRNPAGATQRLRLVGTNADQAIPPEWSAERAFEVGGESVWVSRCVEVIANAVASCPIRAVADPSKPEDHNPRAPLAQLLGPEASGRRGPNPETSARGLVAWSVAQLLLAGRFGWEIEWTGKPAASQIAALWPLPAPSLAPVPTDGTAARYFKGFEYRNGRPDPVRFTSEQVFYHWRPSPHDVREPLSVLKAAGLDVSVAVMTDRYQFAFLKNDARPAAVMITDPFPSDDERAAYRRQWRSEHQGVDNAGKLAFLETTEPGDASSALSIETLGLAQKDSQMLETYQAKIRALTVAFGVPLSVLGDASGRTFSNAAAERTLFWQVTVRPLLAELEEAINRNLAPYLGREVAVFDTSAVDELQPAKPFDPAQAAALVEARLITPNEARAPLGLAPIPGGDALRPAAAEASPPALRSEAPVVLHQHLDGRAPAAPVEARREDRAAEWRRLDAQAQTFVRSWERALARYFERQGKAVVARIEGRTVAARLRAAAEAREVRADIGAFDREQWLQRLEQLAADLYEQVVGSSAARVAGQFGVSFDLEAPWVQDFIAGRANQLAAGVTDWTYAQLQQALADGAAAGEGVDKIADRVRDVFTDASTNRAQTIARTEVISASNGSAVESARQLPPDVVAGKEWIATRDDRTRDDHAEADGQVVPVDGTFEVGGERLAYPGDPNADGAAAINCRCAVAFVAAEAQP